MLSAAHDNARRLSCGGDTLLLQQLSPSPVWCQENCEPDSVTEALNTGLLLACLLACLLALPVSRRSYGLGGLIHLAKAFG